MQTTTISGFQIGNFRLVGNELIYILIYNKLILRGDRRKKADYRGEMILWRYEDNVNQICVD